MSTLSPRRLIVVAGFAAALVGCSTSQDVKVSKGDAAAPSASTAPAPAAATPAAPAPTATAQPAAEPVRRGPTPTGRWNGTTQDLAKKPGSYIVVNGKVEAVPAVKLGDKSTVAKIISEGKDRNQVMDHLTHLATKIGPRLTGSTNVETANKWAMEQFKSWGLESSLHEWGTIPVRFDRGPSSAKVGTVRENGDFRSQRDMEFTTLAWIGGTEGPVRGQVLKMPENEAQFEAVKDKLKGSWVLIKASGQGRRGVGGFAGGASARQRFFAETRKKIAVGELSTDTKPAAKTEPKAEAAAPATDGIAGNWEGTATGGPIPEGGTPFNLTLKLEGAAVTGTMAFPGFHSGPIKEGKWDEGAKSLSFVWENPVGAGTYTFKIDGQTMTGEVKLPEDMGGSLAMTGKRGAAPKVETPAQPEEESESKGPTLEERVFMAGPAGYISASGDERVRTSGSHRNLTLDTVPKDVEVQVRQSDYDWMNSRVADGVAIHAEINCDHKLIEGPIKVYNTVAEIKGTQWPDEVVIVSAHLDSWNGPGSQGTTDNGTGSSVTIEAARILAAVGAKPKRTIRFILWTGEEQGLLGSRAYVKELKEKDLLKNISAVFVDDGGTNFEGGLQCLDSQVEYLGAATAPINGVFWSSTDQRFLDVNIQPGRRMGGGISGGSSDHASFLAEKVPGYFWDEVGRADYPYGWHTQNDKLDLAIPEYLKQSSTCAAVTAYNLACAPAMLPREPLPQAEEKKDTSASATTP